MSIESKKTDVFEGTQPAFIEGNGRADSFIRGWYGRYTGDYIARAYHSAAEVLIEERRRISHHGDIVLWPAGFLYRHACELYLKEMISLASDLLTDTADRKKGHQLSELLSTARDLLVELHGKDIASGLHAAEVAIAALHGVDPAGDGFRYELSRKDSPNLDSLPKSVDVVQFARVMDDGLRVLSGCLGMLQDHANARDEWRAEMASEYGSD